MFEEHLSKLLPIYGATTRGQTRIARKESRLIATFIAERVVKGAATAKAEHGEGEPQNIPVAELGVVKRIRRKR